MPRPDVSAERKAQILAAAMTAFAENGFEKTRMEDVASLAGLSKGTLYWYFNSKEEVFSAIQADLMKNQFGWLQEAAEAEGPVAERLQQFVGRFSSELETLVQVQPLMFEIFALIWREEEGRRNIQERFLEVKALLIQMLQEAIASGEFRSDINVRETAVALMAMHEGLELIWLMAPDQIDLPAMKQKLLGEILAGLKPAPN